MLPTAPLVASLFVAVLHAGFFVLESVLWTTPRVRRIFGNSADAAEATKVMAVNQGAYNLALAVLLAWAALTGRADAAAATLIFIAAMGVVGAATAKWTILLVQSAPALLALALLRWA